MSALQSKWGGAGDGLSPHLLATIFAVDQQGAPLAGAPSVVGPITDANIEITANWQSPFEQAGPESKAPTIMAMLQNGLFESYASAIIGKGSQADEGSLKTRLARDVIDFSRSGQGRTGITKLNSTQVFTGAPPVKVTMTMHFRAFSDPAAEVQEPVDQLVRWALARELAPNGNIVTAVRNFLAGQGFLKSLLPSESPQMVAMRYGRQLFSPMVIESIGQPLTVPRNIDGEALHVSVQMVLATLTALDAQDWRRSRAGEPTRLFNNT